MQEIVQTVTCIDRNGNIKTIENNELDFSYRHSRFKENPDIIISAVIKLQKGKMEEIKEKMDSFKSAREDKQPINMSSAGSTFKRGTDFISAKLIDDAGLKGYTIGGAMVSEKHAGFVVNTGNATAEDILNLMK